MQVQLQPAYVLHTRPYRDTSLLVDILSRDYGRLTVVARGQRQSRQKSQRPMQPFAALLLSWQGRSDLKTLTGAEIAKHGFLSGTYLYSGLYANELLMRLLPQGDAHAEIFASYQHLLQRLMAGEELERSLRLFEFALLDELGYGLDFSSDALSGEALRADGIYGYFPESGFIALDPSQHSGNAFVGKDLLAIAAADFSAVETQRSAKRLARMALAPHLGNRPLKSRELFETHAPDPKAP